MLEKDIIQSRGFRNVYEGKKAIGFQVPIRTTYYRSVWMSQLRPATVKVDGETFEGDQITWTVNDKTYEQKDFPNLGDVHWQLIDPAILTVKKPGGLKRGYHNVEVFYTYSACYMPPKEDLKFGRWVSRKLTLAR